ncbi:MAG: radical SAM protein [Oscillospiraceae bacterium]|jgi:putative pyruvate formate lyase activating enzyme|nr:radical SAM protein [Oscillospiraceae bacterium]
MSCTLCPRLCNVNRTQGKRGFCAAPPLPVVAAAQLHQWEEPCISGTHGAGTVFFSGCNLACVYCQNYEISRTIRGQSVDADGLRQMFHALIAQGVHNISLVTPTCYADTIAAALMPRLPVPVVYNCGGYERVETLAMLADKVDVWLPDYKYSDGDLAARCSSAHDYPAVAAAAILAMVEHAGAPVFDDAGLLTRGVLVRHLVLPGQLENTFGVLDWFADHLRGRALLSLMGQFTPNGCAEFDRPLTADEYHRAVDYMHLVGIRDGYVQDLAAVGSGYVPVWAG